MMHAGKGNLKFAFCRSGVFIKNMKYQVYSIPDFDIRIVNPKHLQKLIKLSAIRDRIQYHNVDFLIFDENRDFLCFSTADVCSRVGMSTPLNYFDYFSATVGIYKRHHLREGFFRFRTTNDWGNNVDQNNSLLSVLHTALYIILKT